MPRRGGESSATTADNYLRIRAHRLERKRQRNARGAPVKSEPKRVATYDERRTLETARNRLLRIERMVALIQFDEFDHSGRRAAYDDLIHEIDQVREVFRARREMLYRAAMNETQGNEPSQSKPVRKATLNRDVLFYRGVGAEPEAAKIVKVWGGTCVNLAVFDSSANVRCESSVVQFIEGRDGSYWEWPKIV